MITLAVTGGIATGKTTFLKFLVENLNTSTIFDCDQCVHELLTNDDVTRMIVASLGQDLVGADGSLDRRRLRENVFGSDEYRKTLESILHPLVREACIAARQQAIESGLTAWFIADVPLLYESGFPLPREMDIVIACGPATQRRRLLARSGFSSELAERIVRSQLSIAEKLDRADVVLWNGGAIESLRNQTEYFSLWLMTQCKILKPPYPDRA